ncbi:hypothetical protein M404DRAFT_212838 [Pisolithus tinctorius Marx 270]|uniref:Uncharacterized protein n=1 Tax=Pisolithus tinctorius Marx 270 TaxID=870435 RepID=A0A0C3PN63_PISTI|nr:hypothetical protein M404DRAFT_212838 [Pisolithus tinctorius Marx 270]
MCSDVSSPPCHCHRSLRPKAMHSLCTAIQPSPLRSVNFRLHHQWRTSCSRQFGVAHEEMEDEGFQEKIPAPRHKWVKHTIHVLFSAESEGEPSCGLILLNRVSSVSKRLIS